MDRFQYLIVMALCLVLTLPVFALAMGGHGSEKTDRMARHRNVRMKSAGHKHCIALPDDRHQLRILSMVIHKLNSERRIRHVEINIHLFQHLGVFVRRPARPVTGFGDGKSGNQPSSFNILRKQHVKLA